MLTKPAKLQDVYQDVVSLGSGECATVRSFLVCNRSGSTANVSVTLRRGSFDFPLFSEVEIGPGGSSSLFANKDVAIYMEGGDRLVARCNMADVAHVIVSYEKYSCASEPGGSSSSSAGVAIFMQTNFSEGADGWVAGFADFPEAELGNPDWEMESGLEQIPIPGKGNGFMLQGANRSDDLFMFIKKQIGSELGILPNRLYSLNFSIQFASDAPEGAVGIGGPPGEAVTVKAGGGTVEPSVSPDEEGWLRLNLDKGNQSVGGADLSVAGDFSNGSPDPIYRSVSRSIIHNYVRSDSQGRIWLVVGTDSGFEGKTKIYYERISVQLNHVSESSSSSSSAVSSSSSSPLKPKSSVIRDHINNTILNRLSGKDINSDAFLYTNNQDPYGKVFERDSRCWLNGVSNISCMSVAQLDGSIVWWEKTVTLISPRHVHISAHWGPCGAGLKNCPDDPVEVLFVDEFNNVVSRNIVSTISGEPGGAFFPEAVGLLDSDVPPNIKFAKVLPTNWKSYFNITIQRGGVVEVLLPSDTVYTVGIKSTNSDRYNPGLERYKTDTVLLGKIYSFEDVMINTKMSQEDNYWENDILKDWALKGLLSGNSSNQQFLIIDNDLVLLNNWFTGASDYFISQTQNYEKINNAMIELGGGYTLTPVDLESVYNLNDVGSNHHSLAAVPYP